MKRCEGRGNWGTEGQDAIIPYNIPLQQKERLDGVLNGVGKECGGGGQWEVGELRSGFSLNSIPKGLSSYRQSSPRSCFHQQ